MGGIRHTTGDPDRPPARCGISLGDSLAALFAVIGTLAALNERHVSGQGQEVDVANYEAVFALMESTLVDYELADVVRSRTGSVLPGVAPSNAYRCADGAEVTIAGNADNVFARLCDAMGEPGLATDPRFATHEARGANQEELDLRISSWTGTLPAGELLALLERSGVPAGRIYTAPDILADPQYAARDMILRRLSRGGLEVPLAGVVPRFTRTPGRVRDVGPCLGEHTRRVLTEVGVADDEYTGLVDAGLVAEATDLRTTVED